MSRRLVISILAILIIGILGGTIVFVSSRLRGDDTPTGNPATISNGLETADRGSQALANPEADDDSDGLTNAEEVIWGTDPNNADTDGDGFQDGEEVAANHNPTIPSPNDKLPEGFRPGQNLQPLDLAPIEVDQFFVTDLNLEPDSANYTDEYQRRFSEADRTEANLIAFVKEKSIITQLPDVNTSTIKTEASDTVTGLNHYLDLVDDTDRLVNPTVMSQVFIDLFENNDASSAYGLAVQTRALQTQLIEANVPPSAVSLHRLLVGFTELLVVTYSQMATYPADPAKGLVAVNQLDALDRQYIPLIQREIIRLEAVAANL